MFKERGSPGQILTTQKNPETLIDLPRKWLDRVRQRRLLDKLILDLDSSVSETYGGREHPSSAARPVRVRWSALVGDKILFRWIKRDSQGSTNC